MYMVAGLFPVHVSMWRALKAHPGVTLAVVGNVKYPTFNIWPLIKESVGMWPLTIHTIT